MYWEIAWVQRAILDQYRIQGIKPGERVSIPFSKLYEYCPNNVFEYSRSLGKQDFQVVAASMEIATELRLIGKSDRTGKRRAHEYWLLSDHPAVRAEWAKQGKVKLKLVHSTH